MSVVITVADVKNGYPTTVPDDEIQMLIDVVDLADPCLDAAAVPDAKQKVLKIYGVRHMLAMQANGGKGTVTSQHAPSGASQSFSAWKGQGVTATPYGSMLKQLDVTGCVVGLLENDGGFLGAWSIGRRTCE